MTTLEYLAGAQGEFVILIASLTQRSGVAPTQELSNLLNLFTVTVADT